ncbi:hypothetical protein CO151_07940 [bacterium CG_4_9_14_3_um_filter_65_15]|nr:MAG: hypothetical protein CO151_07940 [bacterium CG_4_9_14_3_um_filter_65_15]
MRRIQIVAGLMILAVAFAGCGDDGVSPGSFSLTVEVVDADGKPVSGLAMALAADLPYYQDLAGYADKSRVTIPYSVATPCSVRVTVEDVAGVTLAVLEQDLVPAGRNTSNWIGRNDAGQDQDSGVYYARMQAIDPESGTLLFEETVGMYMALLDPSGQADGETDAAGRVTITDRRYFPSLFGVEDIPATDESGETVGMIHFDGSMRFDFYHPDSGQVMHFFRVVSGPGTLKFVWDPPAVEAPAPAGAPRTIDRLPPPAEFGLRPAYPNPFN